MNAVRTRTAPLRVCLCTLLSEVIYYSSTKSECPFLHQGVTLQASPSENVFPDKSTTRDLVRSRSRSPLKTGPTRCPKTPVKDYHSTLRNNPEECRFQPVFASSSWRSARDLNYGTWPVTIRRVFPSTEGILITIGYRYTIGRQRRTRGNI
jgi:hypothetical protein